MMVLPSLRPSKSPTQIFVTLSPTKSPSKMPITASPSVDRCSRNAQKVKLQSTTGEHIQMFEFQAFASGVNIARNGTATQSSTFNSLSASRAVDDNMATFSHTNDINAWWELTFDQVHSLESLTIFNRYCGGNPSEANGCLCRLSEAELLVLDENDSTVWSRTLGDTCGRSVLDFDLSSPCPVILPPSLIPTQSPTQNPVAPSPTKSPSKMPITVPPSLSPANWPTQDPVTPSPTIYATDSISKSPSLSPIPEIATSPPSSSQSMIPTVILSLTSNPHSTTSSFPSQNPVTANPTRSHGPTYLITELVSQPPSSTDIPTPSPVADVGTI